MRIYLGGYLTFYAGGQHWVEVDLPAPAPLKEVLSRVNIPAGEVFLTAVNGALVPHPEETWVSPSDEVRLYPPADGGAPAHSSPQNLGPDQPADKGPDKGLEPVVSVW